MVEPCVHAANPERVTRACVLRDDGGGQAACPTTLTQLPRPKANADGGLDNEERTLPNLPA